jgi:23S rRNA G2445 N2-methylase RlmL
VAGAVTVERRALSKTPPPTADRGWLVTNPPYGKRIDRDRDLRALYAALGAVISQRFAAWHVALLVADSRLAGQTGLRFDEALRTQNGGIPVRILTSAPSSVSPS